MNRFKLTRILVTGGILAAAPAPLLADPVADFYKGKNVIFRVGYGPGGGYDTTARIVARYLGNYIPGKPTVTVDNMPGAGSLVALNQMYNAGPRDGTLMVSHATSAALEPLIGNDAAKFDVNKITWIGSLHSDINSCAVWKGAEQDIKNLDDLIKAKKEVVFGSTGPGTITTKWPLFLKNVFNAPIKVIEGYKGSKAITLAMPRGEVHAICGMFESSARGSYMNDIKSGDLKFIVQVGLRRKVPLFGDAVQIGEATKHMGKEMEQIVRYVFGPAEITRPIAAPPDIPADRTAALRKALLDTMKDPGVVETGAKIDVEWKPTPGEELRQAMLELYATPKEIIEKATKLTVAN